MKIKEIKKIQTEEILEMENLGKETETADTSIIKRMQEMEVRISDVEYKINEIDTSVIENVKSKSLMDKKHPASLGYHEKKNLTKSHKDRR